MKHTICVLLCTLVYWIPLLPSRVVLKTTNHEFVLLDHSDGYKSTSAFPCDCNVSSVQLQRIETQEPFIALVWQLNAQQDGQTLLYWGFKEPDDQSDITIAIEDDKTQAPQRTYVHEGKNTTRAIKFIKDIAVNFDISSGATLQIPSEQRDGDWEEYSPPSKLYPKQVSLMPNEKRTIRQKDSEYILSLKSFYSWCLPNTICEVTLTSKDTPVPVSHTTYWYNEKTEDDSITIFSKPDGHPILARTKPSGHTRL